MQKIRKNIFLFTVVIIAMIFLEACWVANCRRWEDKWVAVSKQRCISWDTKGYCILHQYYTENEKRPVCVEYEKKDKDDTTKPSDLQKLSPARQHEMQASKFMKAKQYDLAAKEYTKLIELEPRDPWWRIHRGVAYISINQYDQAMSDFSKVTVTHPRIEHAYLYRAEINCRLGKYDLAGNDIKKLMSLDKKIGELLIKDSVDCTCLRRQLGSNIRY